MGCLDANTDSVETFSSTEYNAVVANPEVLLSQKGDQVRNLKILVIDLHN